MVTVTVMYPAGGGATFDMDYYRTTHREICERVLGIDSMDIEKGIEGQPFLALGRLHYSSAEAMAAGLGGPDAGEAMTDVANFTNVTPQMQISESVD